MKKTIKKFMAALLAVAMLCAMAVPAAFAEGTTFKINAPTTDNNHIYEIYQIFTGTPQTKDGSTVLTEVKWGTNAKDHDEGTAVDSAVLEELGKYASETNERTVLTEVEKYVDLTTSPAYTLDASNRSVSVPAGYYLIKDQDSSVTNKGDSYTLYIVQVLDRDLTITPKTDAPSVEKKVKENSNKYSTDGGYGAGYNDTADYNIGDEVPFKLIGTIPDMTHYETYKYIFHDDLSDSLTAPAADNVEVYLSNSKSEDGTKLTTGYNVQVDGQKITVTFDNLKSIANGNSYVIVKYNAVLNSKASIGQETSGNINKVYLEYSNNPNNDKSTGTTVEDQVIVFTYKLEVTKVDGKDSETKLAGAQFKLLNSTKDKGAEVADGKFVKWVDVESASVLTSNDNGMFSVAGLDDGTYYLRETQAPEGYNALTEDIALVISANTSNGQTGSAQVSELITITIKVGEKSFVDGTVSNGTVGATIENNKGATLPSTGGIGTTIFYVVGGGLMVAAAILLITKKRMENK